LGHAVLIFGASSAPLGDGELSLSGAVSHVFSGTETGLGIDPRAWRRAGQLLARSRFDVIHMHEPLMPLVPWFVLLQSTAPVVATFHTYREQGHRWYPRYRWIFERLMRRIRVRRRCGRRSERSRVIRFGMKSTERST
jgi:phosphatidylinositol alpha-mannosyltransferase